MNNIESTADKDVDDRSAPSETGGRDFRLRPAVDIVEDDDAIRVVADVPGVTTDSLRLEVDNDVLTLEGDIQLDMPERMSATYAEIRGSRYYRQFQLGREVDADAIKAEVRNGVLNLVLPKRAQHRRRRIEVQSG